MYQEMYHQPPLISASANQKSRRSHAGLRGQGRMRNDFNNMQVDSRQDPNAYDNYQRMEDGYDGYEGHGGHALYDGYDGHGGHDFYDGHGKYGEHEVGYGSGDFDDNHNGRSFEDDIDDGYMQPSPSFSPRQQSMPPPRRASGRSIADDADDGYMQPSPSFSPRQQSMPPPRRASGRSFADDDDDGYMQPSPSFSPRQQSMPPPRKASSYHKGRSFVDDADHGYMQPSPSFSPRQQSMPPPRRASSYHNVRSFADDADHGYMQPSPSFSPRQQSMPSLRSKSHGSDLNLGTSDQAFQMTAKLVIDYLRPKMEENSSSYYLDAADIIFLEAVVPEKVRSSFVKAISFRAGSIAAGNPSPLESLVKDCQRLGLGQDDSFLVGGGTKMDDGRILVEVAEKKEMNTKRDDLNRFKTSDQEFQMTAKLVTDHLSPKLQAGASSYHIDDADVIYLEAIVPHEIRPNFVDAVCFRAKSLPDETSELSPIESLVKECIRLGLDKTDCFLLGGGTKMGDGRILVLTNGSTLGLKKKKKKNKKTQSQINKTAGISSDSSVDMSWLLNSGLPPEQMGLILSNMLKQKTGNEKTLDENGGEVELKTQEKPKIPMDNGRRKRTSKGQATLPPIKSQAKTKKIGRKTDGDNGIMRSTSKIGMSQKGVIGGLKKTDSFNQSGRSLSRRMRSIEARSKIGLYVENEVDQESPIQMNWRDDIWDFAKHGILHKFLVLSFIAPLFALGQIQTRSKLTWLGVPAKSNYEAESVFSKITTFVFFHILANASLLYGTYWYWTQGIFSAACVSMLVVINIAYVAVLVIVCGNTRWSIRRRNNIPQLFELADYLMSLFYLPLVIAQLGRHTVDYSKYRAQIFSATGLPHGVEMPGETKYVQPQIVLNEGSVMV